MEDFLITYLKERFINSSPQFYDDIYLNNVSIAKGHQLIKNKDSEVMFKIENKEIFRNYFNSIHGGLIASLNDSLTSLLPYCKGFNAHVTLELSTTYLNPIPYDKDFFVLCRVRKIGRKIIFLESEFYDNNLRLCSTGKHTKAIV